MSFPIAIDYQFGQPNRERYAEPLPPIPEGYERIICAEHAEGDEYRTIPAVYRTPDPVQVPGERVLVSKAIVITPPDTKDAEGNIIKHDPVEVQPARYETPLVWKQPDPVLLTPERREQIASGGVKEYEKRLAAWKASQPAKARTYSTAEYVDAVQVALDTAAKAKGYDSILSACTYAAVDGVFQAEGIAYAKWRSNVWAECYTQAANPPAVQPTPAEFVAAILAKFPAP